MSIKVDSKKIGGLQLYTEYEKPIFGHLGIDCWHIQKIFLASKNTLAYKGGVDGVFSQVTIFIKIF